MSPLHRIVFSSLYPNKSLSNSQPFSHIKSTLGQTDHMKWIWNFYLYSFLGFLLEVIYARLTKSKKRDRKCRLLLPLCPVYGLGTAALGGLPDAIRQHPLLLFFAGGLCATAVEYLAAIFYERVWHVRFWDYSGLYGNWKGRICLPFAMVWGALAVVLVHRILPLTDRLTALLPNWLLLPCSVLYLADFALTTAVLHQTGSTRALQWYRNNSA